MNQVECRLAAFKVACEGFGVRKIRLPDLHSGILSPFAALQFRRRANKTTNGVTRIEQTRSQPAANVAGSSGNHDTLWIGAFRQLLWPNTLKSQDPDCLVFCKRLTSKPCARASSTS